MLEYSIRKVAFNEIDSCADVIRRSFAGVAKEFGLTQENCPTNGAFIKSGRLIKAWHRGHYLYGLYCGQELVGFMELEPVESQDFELKKLCVLPEHRHRGFGGRLVKAAYNEVLKMGGNRIVIGIIHDNIRLKQWYMEHGFVFTKMAFFPHLPFTVGYMEMNL